jgi:hypothetical protein
LLGEGTGFTLVSRCNKDPGGAVVVFSDFVTPAVRENAGVEPRHSPSRSAMN